MSTQELELPGVPELESDNEQEDDEAVSDGPRENEVEIEIEGFTIEVIGVPRRSISAEEKDYIESRIVDLIAANMDRPVQDVRIPKTGSISETRTSQL